MKERLFYIFVFDKKKNAENQRINPKRSKWYQLKQRLINQKNEESEKSPGFTKFLKIDIEKLNRREKPLKRIKVRVRNIKKIRRDSKKFENFEEQAR